MCVDVLVDLVGTLRPCLLPRLDFDCLFRRRGLDCRSLCPRALLPSSRRHLTHGLLGSIPPRLLFDGDSLPRRLLRQLPSKPFLGRCDLTRSVLGCVSPRLLFNGNSLPRRLLGQLPSKPFFGRCDLTHSVLGCVSPRLLFNGNNLPRRLLRQLPSKPFLGRCDLTRGLLACVPPRLPFDGDSLPRRLLRQLPSKLFFGRCDLTRSLLACVPPRLLFNGRGLLGRLLDSRRNPPLDLLIRPPSRLFFSLRDPTRGLLGGFPPRLVLSENYLPGGLVGRLAPHPLFSRCDLQRGLLACVPPRLPFDGDSLPRRLLRQLPSKLFFGRCDLTRSLLACVPPRLLFNGRGLLGRLLDSRRNPPLDLLIRPPSRLFFSLRDPTRGLLGGFPPRLVLSENYLPGGLVGRLAPHPLFSRCDLQRGLLGCVPARLLFGERSLPGRLLGQLPSSLLARLLDRHGNPAPNLLICPPPGLLLRFCDLTRGLLAHFPPSPLFGVSNQASGLLGGLVRHCLRRRHRLPHRVFAGFPSCLRRGHGVQLCRRSPRLLVSVQLPLALFNRSAPGRLLLGVHVALDQPLPILGQRLGLILSPHPCGHPRKATYGACPNTTTPQGIPQDLRPESGSARVVQLRTDERWAAGGRSAKRLAGYRRRVAVADTERRVAFGQQTPSQRYKGGARPLNVAGRRRRHIGRIGAESHFNAFAPLRP